MLSFREKEDIDQGRYTIERKENKSPRIPIEVDRSVSVNELYEGYVPESDKNVQLLGDLLNLPYTIESLREYFNIVASNPSYKYYPKIQHILPDPETRSGRIFLRETEGYLIPEYSYLVFIQTEDIIRYTLTPSQKRRIDTVESLNDRELSILQSLYKVTTISEILQMNQHAIDAYLLYSRANPTVKLLYPVLKGIGMILPSQVPDEKVYEYVLDNIILYREVIERKKIYSQTMTDGEILTYLGPKTSYFSRSDLVDQISNFLIDMDTLNFHLTYHLFPSTYNKVDTFGRTIYNSPYLVYGTNVKNRWIALDELLKIWHKDLFSRVEQDGKYTDEELERLLILLPKFESVFADDLGILITQAIYPRVTISGEENTFTSPRSQNE